MPAPTTGTPVVNSTWRLDVDLDVNGGGNWVQVKGISNFTPGLDNTVQDMSDYDTSGWGADAVTFRKFKLSGDVAAVPSDTGRAELWASFDEWEQIADMPEPLILRESVGRRACGKASARRRQES